MKEFTYSRLWIGLSVLTGLATTGWAVAEPAAAQSNFGRMIQDRVQQGVQQFENHVQGSFGPGRFPPPQQPPITNFPYPPRYQPGPGNLPPNHNPYPGNPYPGNPYPGNPYPSNPGCTIMPVPYRLPNRGVNPVGQAQPKSQPATQPAAPTGSPESPSATDSATDPQKNGSENKLPEVRSGQEVAIDGVGFGERSGRVLVKIGEILLSAETTSWSDETIDAVIPSLPLVEPTEALIAVLDAEQNVVQRLPVRLVPSPSDGSAAGQSDGGRASSVEASLPSVQLGTEVDLAGTELGAQAGAVQVVIGDSKMAATVVSWTETEATIKLPQFALAEPVSGAIQLFHADGGLVSEVQVLFRR